MLSSCYHWVVAVFSSVAVFEFLEKGLFFSIYSVKDSLKCASGEFLLKASAMTKLSTGITAQTFAIEQSNIPHVQCTCCQVDLVGAWHLSRPNQNTR